MHLEVILDLILESFMLAFRKFTSCRFTPTTVILDNTLTYLVAAEELTRLFQSPSLKTAFEHHGATWKFISKNAPWYGGFWERLVGLTKQSLRKVLGRAFVTLPAKLPGHMILFFFCTNTHSSKFTCGFNGYMPVTLIIVLIQISHVA